MLAPADADGVARAFALGEALSFTGPVARGVIGQIWRLETRLGTWAVKEWFGRPNGDELEAAARFQEAASAAGVPCPTAIRTPEGGLLAEIDETTTRVQGWVDLRDRDPMLDPGSVGRLVARMHQVPFEGGPPLDPWYVEPVGADTWEGLATELDQADAPFAGDLMALLEELAALDALVVPPREVRTCHRDLWADNLRSTTSGDLCLIDWEDCGLADPSMELATVLWEFGRSDATRARALHEAYRGADGPGHVDETDDFSMAIAQLGHIGARACRDWLEPGASDEERSFAASWFGEFTEEPLTRASIEMLLGAVR
jgi:aminoglycoside phosphotransferase (APT) family kinase protein